MTETRMQLSGLLEKGADEDFLRVLAEQVLQLLMEAESPRLLERLALLSKVEP